MIDKCPKCEETDCDCVIKDEELGPMLVMQAHPEIQRDLNLQVNKNPGVLKYLLHNTYSSNNDMEFDF